MKRLILFSFLLMTIVCAFSQIKPVADSCVVVFGLTSNQNIPYSSRTVVFTNTINGKSLSAVTDSLGKASFLLPKNTKFEILVMNGTVQVARDNYETPGMKGLVTSNYDVKCDIFEEDREGEIFKTDFFSLVDTLQPTDSMTLVRVTLSDKLKEPIRQASVLFRNEISKEVFIGQTSDEGKFQILLPTEQVYGIRLIEQGNRVPFGEISTKLGGGKYTLTLNLDYNYTEEWSYYEKILRNKSVPKAKDISLPDMFTLNNILFDFDKSTLKPVAFVELNTIVRSLKSHKFSKIEISGHTDNFGDDDYNLDLSARRAKAVMNYFIEMGINPRQISSEGKGEKVPVATNETEDGRQLNRRTEIRIEK